MPTWNCFIPRIGKRLAAKKDREDKGNGPCYHDATCSNSDDPEASERKYTKVEKQYRDFSAGDGNREEQLDNRVKLRIESE